MSRRRKTLQLHATESQNLNTTEVQRYLRRRKMTINDAKVVPTASLAMTSLASEMNTDQLSESNFEGSESTQAIVPTSLSTSKGLVSYSQMSLLRPRSVLSLGKTPVRPADLAAPERYQAHETFLLAMQSCLLGSWRAKSWDVDEQGFFNLASPENLGFNWFDFGHLLWQACLHLERSEVHQGRKLIFNAASCLRVGLAVCMPHAISDVLFFVARLFAEGKQKYAKDMIAFCGTLLGGAHSDVRSLFFSLGAIELDSLASVMLQGWDLFSDCIESMDDRLYVRSVYGRIRRLQDDLSVDGKQKADTMTSLLADVQDHRPRSVLGELDCMENIAWTTWKSGELERSIQMVSDALELIKPLQASQNEQWKWQTARLMDIRSFARWDAGDTDGAIHDMQCTIRWKSQHGLASVVDDINTLADWQARMEDEPAAQTNQKRHKQMLDSFVNLTFDDGPPEPVPYVCEGEKSQLWDNHISGCCSEDRRERNASSDQPNTLQHYQKGEVYEQAATESHLTAWKEGVEPAMQEQMLLAVDEISNDGDTL